MTELATVCAELKRILGSHAATLAIKRDDATELYLDTHHVQKNKKPLFFGAVQQKKSSVSFHLMPVYLNPELLAGASAELVSHMQGKSCFNFSACDPVLFRELAALTQAAYEDYRARGFVA